MNPMDRVADDAFDPEPVLTSEEVLALAERWPSEAALAEIEAEELRDTMQRFRL